MRPRLTTAQIWAAPLALGALSLVGLTAALFSDGPGDLVAWVTLSVPLAVVIRHARRPAGRQPRR